MDLYSKKIISWALGTPCRRSNCCRLWKRRRRNGARYSHWSSTTTAGDSIPAGTMKSWPRE